MTVRAPSLFIFRSNFSDSACSSSIVESRSTTFSPAQMPPLEVLRSHQLPSDLIALRATTSSFAGISSVGRSNALLFPDLGVRNFSPHVYIGFPFALVSFALSSTRISFNLLRLFLMSLLPVSLGCPCRSPRMYPFRIRIFCLPAGF